MQSVTHRRRRDYPKLRPSRVHTGADRGERFGKARDGCIHLSAGRAPTKAEADRAHADFRRYAHGFQNGRQFDPPGMASGAGRGGDLGNGGENLRSDSSNEGDVEGVRQPEFGMAVED